MGGHVVVGAVVAADVHGLALAIDQLLGDFFLVLGHLTGDFGELGLEVGILVLLGEGLRPVEREVEVAAAGVQFVDPAGGVALVFQMLADGLVQRGGQEPGLVAVVHLAVVLERGDEGAEFTQGVPAQVSFLDELLDVPGGRAAGAGLEHAATVEQGDDREHLGAGAQFQDGEEVGEVVAQDVAGYGDGVLAGPAAGDGGLHGIERGQDADVKAGGVVFGQVLFYLFEQLGVVGAVGVKPENGGLAGETGAGHAEFHPVLDGDVLGLAHPEDVVFFDALLHERVAGGVHHADGSVAGGFKGLVVGAVLLGGLGHEADVGDAAQGGRVEGAVLLAVFDDSLVDGGVGAVGDQGNGVVEFVVGTPGAPAVADDHGHGGVNDGVAGNVEVGDAPVGVHHHQVRAALVGGLDVGFDLRALGFRQVLDLGQHLGDAVVRVNGDLGQGVGVLVEHVLEENRYAVSEDDGVGDAHHGGLEVEAEENVIGFGLIHFLSEEAAQSVGVHNGAVEDFAGLDGDAGLEIGNAAVAADELNGGGSGLGCGNGHFGAEEVAVGHVADASLGDVRPVLHHAVGVALAVFLDGGRGAAVRVSFADDGVDRAAQDAGIAHLDFALGVVGGLVGVVGNVVPLALQLGDGALQLGNGRADVGQFDEIGRRLQAQLAAHAQVVGDSLLVGQIVGEVGDDAAGQRDVPGLQLDARTLGESLENREQGVGGEVGRLVGFGVNDLGSFWHDLLLSKQVSRAANDCQGMFDYRPGHGGRMGRIQPDLNLNDCTPELWRTVACDGFRNRSGLKARAAVRQHRHLNRNV